MLDQLHQPPAEIVARAHANADRYAAMYAASVADPETFWGEHGRRLDWIKPYTRVKNTSFAHPDVSIKWFEDGKLNVSANCIDRHLATRGDQIAIIWESDDPEVSEHITYRQLHAEVSKFANVLHSLGVRKGDRVVIYLPMIPQAAYAMLACARIGAVHSVVFAGFSADALRSRIADSGAKLVVTADEAPRGGRRTPLKASADKAVAGFPGVRQLVVKRTGGDVPWDAARDVWLHEAAETVADHCEPVAMGAEDPLFILYTSGSTGQPKGVLHTTGGYLVYAAMTPRIRLRLPRRRHLLVHRGRRLGHRPQLHRLRPARQRRDDADVRGRADLARRVALLAGLREAPGQHLLHRPDRHPRPDGPGPRMGRQAATCRPCASSAPSASRSTRRPGTGTTRSSATTAARSSTPGGRPRPAAS